MSELILAPQQVQLEHHWLELSESFERDYAPAVRYQDVELGRYHHDIK